MGVRARWVAVAVAVAVALTGAACGSDDASTGASTATEGGDGATTEGTISPAPSLPHGLGPPPTNADGSTPSTVLLPQSPLGPWSLDVAASDDFPSTGGPTASLVAVRTGVGEGTQRIVFEFAGDVAPGWQVGYEPLPVLADPSGEPVPLVGSVALVVRMTPAATVDLEDGSFTPTYDGPPQLAVEGGSPAGELVLVGDFEGLMTWAVGLDARVPFVADTLASPARVVIDLLATGP